MSMQLEPLRQLAPRPFAPARPEDRGAIVFASGKGGTGTSTLAALFATRVAEAGRRVLLVDGSVGPGSLHLYLGVDGGEGWSALKAGATPGSLLVQVDALLTLLPAGEETQVGGAISPAERQVLFRRISSLYAGYDAVVVDGGSRLDSVLAACAPGAARLVAVTTPDRVSIAATYALVKAVGGRLPELPLTVLTNRGDREAAESIRLASQRFLARALEGVGAIPDDECLRAGINAGMDIQDAAADSPAATAMLEVGSRFVRGLRAAPSAGDTPQLSRRS